MRIEPPPSPALALVQRPPATAAAAPPDEPPGVRPSRHGLCVAPFKTVRVTLTPPNSLAVVSPKGTMPPSCCNRCTMMEVCSAMRSAKTAHAEVSGQPSTASSSLTASGTPPKGSEVSALCAAASALVASMKLNALRLLFLISRRVAASSSAGLRRLARNSSTREHASPCQDSRAMCGDVSDISMKTTTL